jgi:hypothetical protein
MVPPEGEESKEGRLAQYIGVGCFTAVTGFFSCAMIAVLVARIVGTVTRCTPPAGLPACDWYYYAGVGGLLGATVLPVIVLRILRRGGSGSESESDKEGS